MTGEEKEQGGGAKGRHGDRGKGRQSVVVGGEVR